MTTITLPRATVEQALEALEASRRSHYYCEDTWYSCPKHEDGCSNEMEGDECNCGADEANEKIDQSITALRAALAQQAEPTGKKSLQVESVVAENATTQQQIEQTPPSDYRRGYWDGFRIGKREGRIEAEDAAKQAEPVEPYCYVYEYDGVFGLHREFYPLPYNGMKPSRTVPVYTAPPQRKPLTDEDILRVLMLDPPNPSLWPHLKGEAIVGDVQQAVLAIVRAVERALEEKNRGR